MLEVYGDAIELARSGKYTGLCITTNGFVKSNGECVMGRGIALTIAKKIPQFPAMLGARIRQHGNHVHVFPLKNIVIYTFPVKHNWCETADIALIQASCQELMNLLSPNDRVLLPRPGCGNGKLLWQNVKPVIEPLLDDRVSIVTWNE